MWEWKVAGNRAGKKEQFFRQNVLKCDAYFVRRPYSATWKVYKGRSSSSNRLPAEQLNSHFPMFQQTSSKTKSDPLLTSCRISHFSCVLWITRREREREESVWINHGLWVLPRHASIIFLWNENGKAIAIWLQWRTVSMTATACD